MLLSKYTLKDIYVGSGSIIGRYNIEKFFGYVSRHKDFEDRSLVELAQNYEIAIASSVSMLEARFVNLHPILQQMFRKLESMENGERRILYLNFASGT